MKPIKAIIFDMDDTLVSTASLWREAEERFMEGLGLKYDPELAQHYKGMNAPDIGAYVHREVKPHSVSLEGCQDRMRSCLLEAYHRKVEPMPGVEGLLKKLEGRFKMAVASGSPKQAIGQVLESHGWKEVFDTYISSEEVERGKPSPDVFLAAAERLGAHPDETLVFEDSLHGLAAAGNAGMRCFLIPSFTGPKEDVKADRVFESCHLVRVEDITEWPGVLSASVS